MAISTNVYEYSDRAPPLTRTSPTPPLTWTGPALPEPHTMASLAAVPADQAVLVVMADVNLLASLMGTAAFKALLTQGRTLFATPAVGDSLVLTGETAVATLSVAAKPSA